MDELSSYESHTMDYSQKSTLQIILYNTYKTYQYTPCDLDGLSSEWMHERHMFLVSNSQILFSIAIKIMYVVCQ
jgi:hypothetical protein